MPRIKIVNETDWNTRDLRKFITAGLLAERGDWHGTYLVEVKRGRRGQARAGWGYYHRNHMCLFIDDRNNREDVMSWRSYKEASDERKMEMLVGWRTPIAVAGGALRWVAIVIAHEADHNKGLKHRVMSDAAREVEWADRMIAAGFVIRRERPAIVAPKSRSVQELRAAHAAKMLAKHERQLAREEKLVAKWRRVVKYYERATERRAAKSK